MKVLIAIDDSKYSEAAVQSIADRPWWGDTQFTVLSILPELSSSFGSWPAMHSQPILEAQEAMSEKLQILTDSTAVFLQSKIPACSVHSVVLRGSVADKIVSFAKTWHADLIVMGSHHRKGLSLLMLGSIAEEVLHHAPCSVEIVRLNVFEGSEKLCAQKEHAKQNKSAAV